MPPGTRRKLVSTEIHLNPRSYYRKGVAAAVDEVEVDSVDVNSQISSQISTEKHSNWSQSAN